MIWNIYLNMVNIDKERRIKSKKYIFRFLVFNVNNINLKGCLFDMKKRLSSIALSTVVTSSLLLSPMVNAEEINTSKVNIQESVEIQTPNQEVNQEIKGDEKQLSEEKKEISNEVQQSETKPTKEEQDKQSLDNKTDNNEKPDKQSSDNKMDNNEKQELEEKKQDIIKQADINNNESIENVDPAPDFIQFKPAPQFAKMETQDHITKDMDGISEFFNQNKDIFNINNPKDEFEVISEKTDNLGSTHIKLQQVYKGIPLFGKEYIVHFNESGNVYAVNGKFDNIAYKKLKNSKKDDKYISKDSAIESAKSEIEFNKLIADPSPELYYYEVEGSYLPVYEVRLSFIDPEPGDWYIFIDAKSGDIVNKYNKAPKINSTGTGIGVLGDTKEINLDKTNGYYYMTDNTRNGTKIMTYDMKGSSSDYRLPGTLMYDTDNKLDSNTFKPAVDAHKYAGHVYDYYKNKFGRNSIDNKGMDIKSSVHYGRNYVNAFWNNNQIVYGDGDGKTAVSLSGALDVVGHEMTHGVVEYEANLAYQNQSGALNESFADVFGTLIEYEYQKDKADWLCGEDVWTPNVQGDALRSLSDPTRFDQPDHMNNYKNLPNTEQGDWGGVHINSGIPNKAAYLVAQKIGTDKTGEIYYRALTSYLTSSATFKDARMALIQSAEDIYGVRSSEYNAVVSAFDAVGIK